MPAHQGRPQRAHGAARPRYVSPSTPQAETLLARTVRGLEWLAAAEIETDLNARVLHVGHREIVFHAPLDPAALGLGSIDDMFLLCGKVDGIDRGRTSLSKLEKGLQRLPLRRALERIESLRPLRRSSGFEVIGSFLGRRNYGRGEIEASAGRAICGITGMVFHDHETEASTNRGVSWRIHVRDDQAIVALRVAPRPLHRRDYRTASGPGALHPPVAYAMAMLSGAAAGSRILDPCCGTGTLPIEAMRLVPDAVAIGSDIDSNSLAAAASNGANADCRWVRADLGCLPYGDGFADCVLANLPWGRKVQARGAIEGNTSLALDEIMRVLAPHGNAVLLAPPADAIVRERDALLWCVPIRLAGRLANIQIVSAADDGRHGPVCLHQRYGRSFQRMWSRYGSALR
jgi:23S rRNA G2445 N2-methylase RlmL